MSDELSTNAIISNRMATSSATKKLTDSEPVSVRIITPIAINIEAKLEILLRICMSAKKLLLYDFCENLLKAQFSNLYHGKSYMDCYYYYQQYEDYFNIGRATISNRTLFIMSFLCITISYQLSQYK